MRITRREMASLLGLAGLSAPALAADQGPSTHAGVHPRTRETGAPRPKPAAAHGAPAIHKGPATPEEIWTDLMDGNTRFVTGHPRQRALIQSRKQLVHAQHPQVIVLGCADSRLCPELIFDKGLGDLFVVRTAGNVADPVAVGSLEYAAEHLHARVLVVLGHEGCGAVKAAISGEKMATPGLEAVVDHIKPAVERVRTLATGDELERLVATVNVYQSAADLLKSSPILAKEVAEGKLAVIKAVYKLSSGKVVRL